MDVIAHAVYGATVFSRTGLSGGSKGAPSCAGSHWSLDWTVWVAAMFGMLPDVVSLGVPFVSSWLTSGPGNFFTNLDSHSLILYRYMHSMIVALAVSCLVRLAWKPMLIPSLAWPLHVIMDSLTHGAGKFQTTLLYPLSSWGFDSIRWWRHPGFILIYWLLLPVLWTCIWAWRRHMRQQAD